MTDEELILRLRDWPYQGETMAGEAADRIEALVQERDILMERHQRNLIVGAETRARAEQLAATNKRLEAALRWQAEQPEAHPFMVSHARAALKGADHE